MGKKIRDNRTNPAIKAAVKQLEDQGLLTDEIKQELANIDFAVEDYFKEGGTPKRPMNSFLSFAQFRRGEIGREQKYKGYTTGQISKVLQDEYRNNEQSQCKEKAETIRRIHQKLFSNYKYTRRPNGSKKKDQKGKGKGKGKALTHNDECQFPQHLDGVTPPQFVQGSNMGVSNQSELEHPHIRAAFEGGYGSPNYVNGYPNVIQSQGLQGYHSMHTRDEHFTYVPASAQYPPQNYQENVANRAPTSYCDLVDSFMLDPNGISSTQNQGEVTSRDDEPADHYYGELGSIAPDHSSQLWTQNQGVVTNEPAYYCEHYGSFSLEDFAANGFSGSISPGPVAANGFGSSGSVSQAGATQVSFTREAFNI